MAKESFDEYTTGWKEPVSKLNVVVAFQDMPGRERAMQVCSKVNDLIGNDCVKSTWWEIEHLSDSTTLSNAVRAAVEADVLVVSVPAANELPKALRAWIDGWLKRRRRDVGALVALIGVREEGDREASRTRNYLQAAAGSGCLDFLPHEEKIIAISQRESQPAIGVIFQDLSDDRNSISHWGINE